MLLRSLGAGVTGLKNFQTDLDVIGNNIANVGTTAFKKSRITFEDTFSQTMQGASNNQNPIQIGLGSQTGSVDTISSGTTLDSTGNTFDFGVDGEGYFQITDGAGNTYYTRAGNFKLSTDGTELLDSSGNAVTVDKPTNAADPAYATISGSGAPLPNNVTYNSLSSITVDENGVIKGVLSSPYTSGTTTYPAGTSVTLGRIDLFTFSNPSGLDKVGDSLYQATAASGTATGWTYSATATTPNNGQGSIRQGTLEGSNVDLTDEMTNLITAQRAYQANAQTITTADDILQVLVQLKRN
ncbi:MAG: flagellar hook-basal body complex protein [Sporolactobacillus sp.]